MQPIASSDDQVVISSGTPWRFEAYRIKADRHGLVGLLRHSYSGQDGAPSFPSIADLPRSGCWRLSLTTGELRASVDIEAVPR